MFWAVLTVPQEWEISADRQATYPSDCRGLHFFYYFSCNKKKAIVSGSFCCITRKLESTYPLKILNDLN